ncbi:hypothetical protein FRB90_011397 [Tulasnella sp. 427]|nr:hypothetical protein FRB90_011397 [Tulasnella sp. 427]
MSCHSPSRFITVLLLVLVVFAHTVSAGFLAFFRNPFAARPATAQPADDIIELKHTIIAPNRTVSFYAPEVSNLRIAHGPNQWTGFASGGLDNAASGSHGKNPTVTSVHLASLVRCLADDCDEFVYLSNWDYYPGGPACPSDDDPARCRHKLDRKIFVLGFGSNADWLTVLTGTDSTVDGGFISTPATVGISNIFGLVVVAIAFAVLNVLAEFDDLRSQNLALKAALQAARETLENVNTENAQLHEQIDPSLEKIDQLENDKACLNADLETTKRQAKAYKAQYNAAAITADILRDQVTRLSGENADLQRRLDRSEVNLESLTETLLKRDSDVEAANQAGLAALADADKARQEAARSLAAAEEARRDAAHALADARQATSQLVSTRSELDSVKTRVESAERNARLAIESDREARVKAEAATAENDVLQETLARYEDEALARSADLAELRAELDGEKAQNALSRDTTEVVRKELADEKAKVAELAALLAEAQQALDAARATHLPTPPPSAAPSNDAKTFTSPSLNSLSTDSVLDDAHQSDVGSNDDDEHAAPSSPHSTAADDEAEPEVISDEEPQPASVVEESEGSVSPSPAPSVESQSEVASVEEPQPATAPADAPEEPQVATTSAPAPASQPSLAPLGFTLNIPRATEHPKYEPTIFTNSRSRSNKAADTAVPETPASPDALAVTPEQVADAPPQPPIEQTTTAIIDESASPQALSTDPAQEIESQPEPAPVEQPTQATAADEPDASQTSTTTPAPAPTPVSRSLLSPLGFTLNVPRATEHPKYEAKIFTDFWSKGNKSDKGVEDVDTAVSEAPAPSSSGPQQDASDPASEQFATAPDPHQPQPQSHSSVGQVAVAAVGESGTSQTFTTPAQVVEPQPEARTPVDPQPEFAPVDQVTFGTNGPNVPHPTAPALAPASQPWYPALEYTLNVPYAIELPLYDPCIFGGFWNYARYFYYEALQNAHLAGIQNVDSDMSEAPASTAAGYVQLRAFPLRPRLTYPSSFVDFRLQAAIPDVPRQFGYVQAQLQPPVEQAQPAAMVVDQSAIVPDQPEPEMDVDPSQAPLGGEQPQASMTVDQAGPQGFAMAPAPVPAPEPAPQFWFAPAPAPQFSLPPQAFTLDGPQVPPFPVYAQTPFAFPQAGGYNPVTGTSAMPEGGESQAGITGVQMDGGGIAPSNSMNPPFVGAQPAVPPVPSIDIAIDPSLEDIPQPNPQQGPYGQALQSTNPGVAPSLPPLHNVQTALPAAPPDGIAIDPSLEGVSQPHQNQVPWGPTSLPAFNGTPVSNMVNGLTGQPVDAPHFIPALPPATAYPPVAQQADGPITADSLPPPSNPGFEILPPVAPGIPPVGLQQPFGAAVPVRAPPGPDEDLFHWIFKDVINLDAVGPSPTGEAASAPQPGVPFIAPGPMGMANAPPPDFWFNPHTQQFVPLNQMPNAGVGGSGSVSYGELKTSAHLLRPQVDPFVGAQMPSSANAEVDPSLLGTPTSVPNNATLSNRLRESAPSPEITFAEDDDDFNQAYYNQMAAFSHIPAGDAATTLPSSSATARRPQQLFSDALAASGPAYAGAVGGAKRVASFDDQCANDDGEDEEEEWAGTIGLGSANVLKADRAVRKMPSWARQKGGKHPPTHSTSGKQPRTHPSIGGKQPRTFPSTSGKQPRTFPSTGGKQPRTHPSTGGKYPPTGGKQPPTGGKHPPTGGKHPWTGGKQPRKAKQEYEDIRLPGAPEPPRTLNGERAIRPLPRSRFAVQQNSPVEEDESDQDGEGEDVFEEEWRSL